LLLFDSASQFKLAFNQGGAYHVMCPKMIHYLALFFIRRML